MDTWVPLSRARPSLAARVIGSRPATARASVAGNHSPLWRALLSPSRTRDMCASGARSPEAPTEPFSGMCG
ncbi:hypothetical protein FQZ97_1095470 [compost metagenome]